MTHEPQGATSPRGETSLDGEHVDVLIEGSDLPQVISAACLSSLGYKVLLLEPTSNYGGVVNGPLEAALLFDSNGPGRAENEQVDGVRLLENGGHSLTNIGELVQNRTPRLQLELQPRFYFAADALLDLVVGSGAASYLFFQPVDNLFWVQATSLNDTNPVCVCVPCTKAAVTRSDDLQLAEKRWLMRSLRSCLILASRSTADDPLSPALDVSDEERSTLLQQWSSAGASASLLQQLERDLPASKPSHRWGFITALLQDIYAWGIEDSPADPIAWPEGVERVALFFWSVLRFHTSTPFLCCKFGSTEIIQAFARRCAVKGGTIALQRKVQAIGKRKQGQARDSEGPLLTVSTEHGEEIQCNMAVVVPVSAARGANGANRLIRFVGIRRDPLRYRAPAGSDRSATEHALFVVRFKENCTCTEGSSIPNALYIWQISSTAGVCPPGYYLVYAEADFQAASRQNGAPLESITTELTSLRRALTCALRCLVSDDASPKENDAAFLGQVFAAYAFYDTPVPPSSIRVHTRTDSEQVTASYSYGRTDGIVRATREILLHILEDNPAQRQALNTFFGSPSQ
ncbi:hypothetical protein CCYA_CCYA11G3059 [Cyanidiococcus yangmingshanensis]|nr:hypothetical protein CCYA_CCYA11G3059 [Cyanidiococcus yangmingshanensis]